jgi:hypothetical protein
MKCPKNCEGCRVYRSGVCYLDWYNQAENPEAPKVSQKGGRRMRWLSDEFDGRIREDSPEIFGNFESLPNVMDRMLDESSDWYVQRSDEPGSGPSQLSRIIKRREGERLHHPIQDLEEPDEPSGSEDVMDHAVLVPTDVDGEVYTPAEDEDPVAPGVTWDLVYWLEWKRSREGMVPVEESSDQYFMPKFRHLRPAEEFSMILQGVRDGRIRTPLKMFQAMEWAKKRLFQQENGQQTFFMLVKRMWDFFHKAYAFHDPKGYKAWIEQKKKRARVRARNKK